MNGASLLWNATELPPVCVRVKKQTESLPVCCNLFTNGTFLLWQQTERPPVCVRASKLCLNPNTTKGLQVTLTYRCMHAYVAFSKCIYLLWGKLCHRIHSVPTIQLTACMCFVIYAPQFGDMLVSKKKKQYAQLQNVHYMYVYAFFINNYLLYRKIKAIWYLFAGEQFVDILAQIKSATISYYDIKLTALLLRYFNVMFFLYHDIVNLTLARMHIISFDHILLVPHRNNVHACHLWLWRCQ